MKKLGEVIPMINPNSSQQQMPTSQNTHSQSDKNQLARTLAVVCTLQQRFGKTEAELEMMVEGFSRILKHRPMDQIISAIEQYTLKNNNIPAPADVENIINPPRPKPDWAAYVALKKKIYEGYFPLSTERKFLRDCEDYAQENFKEQNDAYREAQQQIENHTKMLEIVP